MGIDRQGEREMDGQGEVEYERGIDREKGRGGDRPNQMYKSEIPTNRKGKGKVKKESNR